LVIVGFQGEPGAFSQEAAEELLGEVDARGYDTFDALLDAVDTGESRCGLLPCENSIHGAVTRAYDVLYAHPRVRIIDETVSRIVQNLIGVPGARLSDVRRIESHAVALEQCRRFLATLPGVEVFAAADTAGSVREVIAAGDVSRAAIGPAASARRYGGNLLAQAVQDEAENYTRFFLIERDGRPRRDLGRAALAFILPHRPGSLHEALGAVARRGLNVRSLLARPQAGKPFEYVFYAELDCPDEAQASALLAEVGGSGRLLGWY
jgi:prephenate dehydratase